MELRRGPSILTTREKLNWKTAILFRFVREGGHRANCCSPNWRGETSGNHRQTQGITTSISRNFHSVTVLRVKSSRETQPEEAPTLVSFTSGLHQVPTCVIREKPPYASGRERQKHFEVYQSVLFFSTRPGLRRHHVTEG